MRPTPDFHPFHLLTHKELGDRVMTPRHPADETRGYYYGTVVTHARILWVRWDEHIPYMPRTSELRPAILCSFCENKV